jgi:YHS domain-containing protein
MNRVISVTGCLAVIAGLMIVSGCAKTETAEKKNAAASASTETTQQTVPVLQKTCPVMGNRVNKDLYYDYNGKRIYVCCAMCIDSVRKEPEKYLRKLMEMGETPENVKEQ